MARINKLINQKKFGNEGFTLIELLVVIAIIGLLSSVIMASLNGARVKSRDSKRLSEIIQIRNAIALYQADHNGDFPDGKDASGVYEIAVGVGWYCLGHGAVYGKNIACWANGQYASPALDNKLAPYMQKIPDDPVNDTSKLGDAYLYNDGRTTDDTTYFPNIVIRGKHALTWGIETCSPSSQICGGGGYGQWTGNNVGLGCGYHCMLPLD